MCSGYLKYLCNDLHSAISNGDGPCLDTRDLSDQHSVDLCSHDGHLIQVIDMPELPGEYPAMKVVMEAEYSRGRKGSETDRGVFAGLQDCRC